MNSPDPLKSRRNEAIIVWSLVFGGLVMAVVYLAQSGGGGSAEEATAEVQPRPVKPEAKLTVVLTDCSQITSRVDFEGGIMVNLGENYRQMKGYVENTGDLGVSYVHVDTLWKNTAGKVIQSGSVYLATDTGLAPGARVDFSDTTQNYLATGCGAKVRDWWIASNEAEKPGPP